VFFGVVGTACVQAVLMATGIWLAGVPAAVSLGFVTLLLALSQIGAPLLNLVWAGAAYWLYSRGQTSVVRGFLVVWGTVVSLLDGVLKPWLIGSSIQMPLALVIVGVFGGFLSFGFLGLFIGPVLIAIAYALLVAWRAEITAGPSALSSGMLRRVAVGGAIFALSSPFMTGRYWSPHRVCRPRPSDRGVGLGSPAGAVDLTAF
jgi:predicted PurR-regulated permease PerM